MRHIVQATVGSVLAVSATLLLGAGTAQAATPTPSTHGVSPTLGPPDINGAENNLGYAITDLGIILSAFGL